MIRPTIAAVLLLLTTFASAQTTMPDSAAPAERKRVGEAAYAATVDYRRHLNQLLYGPLGKGMTFADFQNAMVALSMDAATAEHTDAMHDERVRAFVRKLLDLREPLVVACDAWLSKKELDAAAADQSLTPTMRDMMHRASDRLSASKNLVLQGVREHLEQIRAEARAMGVAEEQGGDGK